MILSDVLEIRNENGLQLNRKLSQCMISGDNLVKIEISRKIYNELCS